MNERRQLFVMEYQPRRRRHDQRAGVVVNRIAVSPVWRRMDGMLKYAGVVGHHLQRVESDFRQGLLSYTRPVPSGNSGPGARELLERLLENFMVLPTHVTPDHLPAEIVRTAPDAFP